MQPCRLPDTARNEHHCSNDENEHDSQREGFLEAAEHKPGHVGQYDRDHSEGDGSQRS